MKNENSRNIYFILRKIRSYCVVCIGLILPNSYIKVLSSKQIYDGPLKQGCVPFLNCHACPTAFMSCPIGIFQHFAAIRQIPFFLFGLLGSIGLIFGRAACGWLCPFGWIQDQLYKIRSKKVRIPKVFSNFKYGFLAIFVFLLPLFTEVHWFSRICPWGTLSAGIPWMLWNPVDPLRGEPVIGPDIVGWLFVMKISILLLFVVLFVMSKRPFCRTVCPLGAIYSFFNRMSIMRMHVSGKCAGCDQCVEICPVEIKISDDPNSPACIRCLKCTICKNVSVQWMLSHEPGIKEIA